MTARRQQEPEVLVPRDKIGVWLVATAATRRPVPVAQPYPHIHGLSLPGVVLDDGTTPQFSRRDCLACMGAAAPRQLADAARMGAPRFSAAGTVANKVEWRWGCPLCRTVGHADSEGHSIGLTVIHLKQVCPATATVYYHPDNPDCYVYRVARHQNLHARFPDDVPAWTGRFRGRKERSMACPPWCRPACGRHALLTREELASLGAEAALS